MAEKIFKIPSEIDKKKFEIRKVKGRVLEETAFGFKLILHDCLPEDYMFGKYVISEYTTGLSIASSNSISRLKKQLKERLLEKGELLFGLQVEFMQKYFGILNK
jgi:hypothetical protein